MFSFLARQRPTTALINGVRISVNAKETLLQAALRHGIDFPHSCRVGGCASCKCKLVSGQVRELTETGYILSDQDLDAGYILACQSVPKGDVCIEVDLARHQATRQVRGRVVAQSRLTHDITRLVIQLEEGLNYRAGQYANLRLDCLPQLRRSFSFATPVRPDAQVSFFIRQVSGGVFTSQVGECSLIGHGVTLEGPLGEFHLRPASAPLLLVAGGSGLAPLLAMLQDALAGGVQRPATLLFGAREARDLYALEEISAIAAQWRGSFRFVPVLSEVAADSSWQGERGLVTAQIPTLLQPGAHAYLCGPPAMIDNASALLRDAGVARAHIHADRFTTFRDMATALS
ncbi:2Fe-2S iron-sulfur cluster-binding protein [Pseudomonas sp. TCU-HL1]|uniref:2Fe-2S iron-sulfur cluster-binding protein n=1 Tax=Pseudomonas sp. TCU-HL1 TaxID=1856685 RepID=UPI00083DAFE9|nr:2Fe-2S iron-sulfur cluster binding domain-containing protein [Pseudomonas sp. TCU-HL1]AOE85237.1 oxidoreductase [Pseudomonas sp. TCU-HL1]